MTEEARVVRLIDEEAYGASYREKKKADGRERTRRCRARKADVAQQELAQTYSAQIPPISLEHSTARAAAAARISVDVAREIVEFANSCLACYDRNIQHLAVHKFLSHGMMKEMIPRWITDLDTFRLHHSVLSSVREGVQDHLVGVKQSKIIMAKDILCTLALSSQAGSGRGVAGLLGVDMRNISKAQSRRLVLDAGQDAFWLLQRRKVRSDSLSDFVKAVVSQWWENETTISPNGKDVVSFHEGLREWILHPTHFLQCSQLEFYTTFIIKYPSITCGLTSFESLKSWWVKRLRLWNTCCCRYHQELTELMIALDNMRSDLQGIHFGCLCDCHMVCGGSESGVVSCMCNSQRCVFQRLTTLWSSILCDKDDLSMWHRRDCLMGNCSDCRLQLFPICPIELVSDKLVKWKSIGYKVIGTTDEGVPRKVSTLEYREIIPCELIDYLKPKLEAFVLHNYVASWQDFQFRELFSFVPSETLISCVDFSENYTLKIQNEIQSMHWHNDQVTILVHITYRLNSAWSLDNEEPFLHKEIHYYVSDDRTHDSLFVQYCFMLNFEFMTARGFNPKNHIVWSDGCSSQFKSARAWYFISRYLNLTTTTSLKDGCQMSWNYFGFGHGKGEVDGAGALLKRKIQTEQLKPDGRKLQSTAQIVQFLKDQSERVHAGPNRARSKTSKFFWEIPKTEFGVVARTDSKQADRVSGNMSNHQCRSVSARDPTLVQFRQLLCFCCACLGYGTNFSCHQSEHVHNWTLHRLSPRAPIQTRRMYDVEEEVEAGTGGEWIADALCVGDNVAVRAPSSEEPFWLMIVIKPAYTVQEAFSDADGNTYLPGDAVFSGFWYERLRVGSRTYTLRNDWGPTSVYTHLVLTSKFSMPPIVHPVKGRLASYELKVDVKDIIDDVVRDALLLD